MTGKVNHLTTLDAGFLQLEDTDRHISLAIGGVAVLAGPPPEFGAVRDTVGSRVLTNPRSTQVLRTHPWDLAAPEWADDPTFDIAHHVRRTALPSPGDDAALSAEIATIMERRLDRARPLWECWVIEGLAEDRWALLIKVHHALADGIAAANLLTALCDDSNVGSFATAIGAAKRDSRRSGLSLPSLNPLTWVGDSVRFTVGAGKVALRAAGGAAELTASLLRPAAPSSLNGPVGDLRRYGSAVVKLRDVEEIAHTWGTTINDVALAAVADSYRAALLRRGLQPRPDSLRTLVPVSVRGSDAMDVSDNRVSLMLPLLPVDVADPLQRLRAVHGRLSVAKSSGQRQAGSILMWATNLVPFPVTAWTVRLLSRLPQRSVVTVVTNVPGPRQPVTMMGHKVLRLLPIPPIAVGFRTGIAIFSYVDELAFGLLVDFDAAPDVHELAVGIERGVQRLHRLAKASGRSRRKGDLLLLSNG
ncbi:wax ester/triacylglycerol synthase family O-acyltransferase [Mycobacterium sp. CVI_P3]|uniref:Diacylglycerol O-acyltransferase n=1 Tax=Mycobacterium pinniadriaticum TaxID=2994102 RepID=A0ABT3SE07_9MYCO|nr:wax ester/triacylglycerol synthase family O-acyltransferase [Mycobacterium pinniadriaticum]MCX2931318.1 wax ester/triacylglycerol synthase family O-acyltransferase [Mycobacterium pinniadriaticum]MCX2937742.1 wax ester/triacylglycerol synthase family O-acyltransferase [Mycobacterium pinniadriaticum]